MATSVRPRKLAAVLTAHMPPLEVEISADVVADVFARVKKQVASAVKEAKFSSEKIDRQIARDLREIVSEGAWKLAHAIDWSEWQEKLASLIEREIAERAAKTVDEMQLKIETERRHELATLRERLKIVEREYETAIARISK